MMSCDIFFLFRRGLGRRYSEILYLGKWWSSGLVSCWSFWWLLYEKWVNLLFAFSKFTSTDSWKKLPFSFLAYDSRLELMNNISDTYSNGPYRAVFKWLSKVMKGRLLNQTKPSKAKINRTLYAQFLPCFEQVTGNNARNSDWFIVLLSHVVISRCNYFGVGFSIVIWKPL